VLIVIVISRIIVLVVPLANAGVTSDTDSAALFCNGAAEVGAGGQTRELLGTEDGKGLGLDLETMGDMGLAVAWR